MQIILENFQFLCILSIIVFVLSKEKFLIVDYFGKVMNKTALGHSTLHFYLSLPNTHNFVIKYILIYYYFFGTY